MLIKLFTFDRDIGHQRQDHGEWGPKSLSNRWNSS